MSAADTVYTALKERILSGAVPGGDLLSENEVAAAMEVSRTPAREAFLRLQAEGLLRLYPRRGALVVPVAEGEAEHIVSARHLIEVGAAAAAPRPFPPEDLDALDGHIATMGEVWNARDVGAFASADVDFHRAIVVAGRNPLTLEFYDRVRDRQRRMTAQSVARRPRRTEALVDEHRHLRGLLAAGEIATFSRALWAHMRTTHDLPPASAPEVLP